MYDNDDNKGFFHVRMVIRFKGIRRGLNLFAACFGWIKLKGVRHLRQNRLQEVHYFAVKCLHDLRVLLFRFIGVGLCGDLIYQCTEGGV